MLTRSVLRILAILTALLAGVGSAGAAHASRVRDSWGENVAVVDPAPGVPAPPGFTPGPAAAPAPPATGGSSSTFVVFGMDWELALAVGLFVLAAALFVGAAVQRRHVAHA